MSAPLEWKRINTLLIEPNGIEIMKVNKKTLVDAILLIEPNGIEII